MPRFNIALVPVDHAAQGLFAALARRYFTQDQDGYLLGSGALAHATLCQFEALREEDACAAFRSWRGGRSLSLALSGIYLSAGVGKHEGYFWTGFSVTPAPELMAMQADLCRHLMGQGIAPRVEAASYNPHMTLARLARRVERLPTLDEGPSGLLPCRPALGLSSDNGVFVREIFVPV